MHFRTGDGRLTQLSPCERDTMVFVCRKGSTTIQSSFWRDFSVLINLITAENKAEGEFVVVPRLPVVVLFRRRLYNPYWSFYFFMVGVALMVLMLHFQAVLIVSGPLLS